MIINNILFLLKTFWIFFSQYVIFLYYKDYEQFIKNITYKLSTLNVLYVKLFQSICLNNDIINDELNNELIKYTDNAPYTKNDIDYETLLIISNNYNIKINNNILPINSGMISLVFIGEKDEKKVVIKLKRKNIKEKINIAIDNLLFFIKLLNYIPILNKYKLNELIYKNINAIIEQTDFKNEVNNLNIIQNNCSKLKYIKIPYVYENITNYNDNVIVMEFINGLKLNKIDEKHYKHFCKLNLKFIFFTILINGFSHGDLHPGNILFIIDENDNEYKYKLGIIDFGFIIKINNVLKEKLLEIIIHLFYFPKKTIFEKFINSGIFEPKEIKNILSKEQYDEILELGVPITEQFYDSNYSLLNQFFDFFYIISKYINKNKLYNYNIKITDDFIKIHFTICMGIGLILKLCKNDYITVINESLEELFHINLLTNK